jgi:hypothetical protein
MIYRLLNTCNNLIPKKVVNNILTDHEIIETKYYPEYDEYLNFDLDYYFRTTTFELTLDEQTIFHKISQIREELARKSKKNQKENENTFKLFDFNLLSLDKSVNKVFSFIVFAVFIICVIVLLRNLGKKEKAKTKNK